MADSVHFPWQLFFVGFIGQGQQAFLGNGISFLDKLDEPFKTPGIHMHRILCNTLQHAHEFLNVDIFVLRLIDEFPHVAVDVLVHPVLVPDDGVIFVEFALYDHSQYLLVVRKSAFVVIWLDELWNRFTDWINCVVEVLVYDFNDWVKNLLLLLYQLLLGFSFAI